MISSLPTEILAQILAYLPPSSLLSLHESCSRFASLIPTTPKRLYSQSQPYNKETQSPEWLFFLAMLERDGCLHDSLVCSKCSRTHHRTQFSEHEQQKSPLERSCLGFDDKLWVCPHRLWTMTELELLRQGKQLKVFHPALWPVEPCQCLKHGMYLHWLFLPVKTEGSGTVGASLKRMIGLPRTTSHKHLRLRDPERRCFKHEECANLGHNETTFSCRMCIEDHMDTSGSANHAH